MNAAESLVPIKLVGGVVPALPVVLQLWDLANCVTDASRIISINCFIKMVEYVKKYIETASKQPAIFMAEILKV
jgi:hypothetical protein